MAYIGILQVSIYVLSGFQTSCFRFINFTVLELILMNIIAEIQTFQYNNQTDYWCPTEHLFSPAIT